MSHEDLKALNARLQERYHLEVGQIVTWKPRLQNKRSDGPFVVNEVLPEPILDVNKESSGSPYFREPLDILVGMQDADDDFVIYHLDSRRLEPVEEEVGC